MKISKIALLGVFVLASVQGFATTYYAVCNCNWTGSSTWSTTPGGAGAALPTLLAGDILVISNFTVTVDQQITITPSITINLISNSATLTTALSFSNGKKLTLSSTTSVINLSKNNASYLNPEIDPGGGGGNSNLIDIGGNTVWNAGNGTVSGTGQLNTNSSNGSLPVVLTSFSVSSNEEGVLLKWSTASEINFNYFSVQRSSDGSTFNEVAQVKGHGTTQEAHNYSYADSNPIIERSYYRLESIDFDGYTQVFHVISVEHRGEKTFHITPNPSDGSTVGLNFNFESEAGASISIYNTYGVLMGTYKVSGTELPMESTLQGGIYLAKYASPSLTKTVRFFVK